MIVVGYRCGFAKGESQNPAKGSYGFIVSIDDRNKYFKREWGAIILTLDGEEQPFNVNLDKDSFWTGNCRELIHRNIKKWFLKNNITPWERGKPPRIRLEKIDNNKFKSLLYK